MSIQTTILPVHILAGGVGLASGFVALYAAKGARLHRKSGMLFVYATLTMSLTGAVIAALGGGEGSVIGGLLTAYLLITGLTTVRPIARGSCWLDLGMLAMALAIGLTSLTCGFQTAATPTGTRDGIPAVIFFKFGLVALLAGVSDLRMMRSGGVSGAPRIARHLWRMCFALYIASASFFLGQADELPKALQIPALLAVPAFLPLVLMAYWLWRVRRTPNFPGALGARSHDRASSPGALTTPAGGS